VYWRLAGVAYSQAACAQHQVSAAQIGL
jgi:hypothetical protein